MSKVLSKLEQVLSDTYALYVKTQNYHWNIHGENFAELHELLGKQYTALGEAIDEIAECMRAAGAPVKADLKHYAAMTKVKAPDHTFNWQHMISDLAESHKVVSDSLTQTLLAARGSDDFVTEDIMLDRLRWHKKATWVLVSNIQ